MTAADLRTATAHYELKSELARVCLPATHVQARAKRRLAWANSISLMFLIIGIAGMRTRPPAPIAVKPLEQPIPAIVEPLPPPPPNTEPPRPEEEMRNENPSEAARVVVVTPESPAIHFSVPTIGTVLAPLALAQAPPPASLRAASEEAAPKPRPKLVNSTGEGGDRPQPEYPRIADELGQSGAVTLRFTADEAGRIVSIHVEKSSGWPVLDRGAQEFIKRHWIMPVGPAGRSFETTINYVRPS